ncbi:MAG: CoA pyrophosphatase [Desulfofustis sp.]|jgi:8-oxo-dGTP pyrophosphatase MutT (NUDIX family)|nr:CoA pyrophosphatase [Desulfofustis sp.]
MRNGGSSGDGGGFQPAEPLAAVAIIRCVEQGERILLVRRARNSRDPWSGHFAFPGGRREEQDPSIFATCVREVDEETGIRLTPEKLVKTLPATVAGGGLLTPVLVQPYLFEVSARPTVRPAVLEIESYLWLETERFRDRANHAVTEVLPGTARPVFPIDDYYIWGFTYKILHSLFACDDPATGSI